MKTIFDHTHRNELIKRIESVNADCAPQWGKMNIYQMVRHCNNWEEWLQGKNNYTYKQEFLGFLFGKFALKRMIKNDNPFDKNIPTISSFKIKELHCDLEQEKKKWIQLLQGY